MILTALQMTIRCPRFKYWLGSDLDRSGVAIPNMPPCVFAVHEGISPARAQAAVRCLALQFGRETEQNTAMWSHTPGLKSRPDETLGTAYVWAQPDGGHWAAFGCTVFRWMPFLNQSGEKSIGWFLKFCWIHPYMRGKGLFGPDVWPVFNEQHPGFGAYYPVSKSMVRALARFGASVPEPGRHGLGPIIRSGGAA